ncbi:hypothetical protein SAMN06265222_11211 [Neorhodopirellula lusitana]|uniref:Alpha-L-fucosidase n=1 Tax=Neorhodopirellula lusitana TaxID=445327 RepID=A0ABY1QES1_9BACT|nr:hypothetical protein [Neorhodopirellula lusitana]SMP69354.1 hypothetical protein SAMN06265222_11211 [Neorhodopirellula lusitana]
MKSPLPHRRMIALAVVVLTFITSTSGFSQSLGSADHSEFISDLESTPAPGVAQADKPNPRTKDTLARKPEPSSLAADIQWPEFLARHDMIWDRVPNRWEVAPYSGNGNVGFLFYQAENDAKNVISLFIGRHDYYDHRLPHDGNEMLWIYRSRLPLGHFELKCRGDIESVDLRLGLWNAELTGQVQTSQGTFAVHGLTHSQHDTVFFQTDARSSDESISISWHPETPIAPVKQTLDQGGGPQGKSWDAMRKAPYPLPPEPVLSTQGDRHFCLQGLHHQRGETTTGWQVTGSADAKQTLTASVHHSFPEHDSLERVQQNLSTSQRLLDSDDFHTSHRQWWHDYYPQSFLTLNDAEKEAFYWIQMYKFASATRGNGPIMDLMGPWYHRTFWPMVWGDLNVQLQYWTHLTANRLSVGESLPNAVDQYADNLAANAPKQWKDSASLAACFPQDMAAYGHVKTPDMLAWVLHDYWLHCQYAADHDRMRDNLFPILKKTVNGYLNFLKDRPAKSNDGEIHISNSWSPEYPGGRGQDINFTIALMRWSCQTLVDINNKHALNDPLLSQWQNVLDNLVDFQIDDNGMRIGKDIAFEKPHRHYSHLLAFYPLAVLTPETEDNRSLLRTSLDHWLNVSINSGIQVSAMPVTGYTATGAASMYAMLGDAERASHYLDFLIKHKNVSSTTMYAEGNPVIESPLSFATCVHDMLLQSWGGKIRVFPAVPDQWGDVAFRNLRTQGAFLVTAKKIKGATEFVSLSSEAGAPCVVQVDIPEPNIYINGNPSSAENVKQTEAGFYTVSLAAGDTATFTRQNLEDTDLSVSPIPISESDSNLFGLSKKTLRLPGHQYYFKD